MSEEWWVIGGVIISALVYANELRKNTEAKSSELSEIKTMISFQTDLIKDLQNKMDESDEDRKNIRIDVKSFEEKIKTLFENYQRLEERVNKMEEKK